MKKKREDKSLEQWLLRLSIMGTAIMCGIIIVVSMVLYMHSARRVYKAELKDNASEAVRLAGEDTIRSLCISAITGRKPSASEMDTAAEAFRRICEEEELLDIVLYVYEEDSEAGYYITNAYPEGYDLSAEAVNISEDFIDRMLDSEAYMEISRKGTGGLVNSVYTDVRDEDGEIIGLVKATKYYAETLEARIRFLIFYMPVCLILIILFTVFITQATKKRIVLPLQRLNEAAASYSGRDADSLADNDDVSFKVPKDLYNDEIGTLWNTCADMEASLKQSIRSMREMTAENEREEAEIRFASQIQYGMLPGADPEIMGHREFSLSGSMTPARGVGGDFYDYFMIDPDHLALVIGDVTGKGIPAALFMMMSMTHIRTQAAGVISPAKILSEANKKIWTNNPKVMFVTVWLGILEISTGLFRECNAGHECPIVLRDGAFKMDITEHDLPLGIEEEFEYTERERTLQPGERIFVYSDGLAEAADANDEQFGFDRILESLNKNPFMKDSDLLANMKDSVYDFVKTAPQYDDLTMLSFTFR